MKNNIGIVCFIAVLVALMSAPSVNESWLDHKLDPVFIKFKEITRARYPNKVTREIAFAKVLAEKVRVIESSTWPLIMCKATFLAQNPGTIHRKDVREVSCSWGWWVW